MEARNIRSSELRCRGELQEARQQLEEAVVVEKDEVLEEKSSRCTASRETTYVEIKKNEKESK